MIRTEAGDQVTVVPCTQPNKLAIMKRHKDSDMAIILTPQEWRELVQQGDAVAREVEDG